MLADVNGKFLALLVSYVLVVASSNIKALSYIFSFIPFNSNSNYAFIFSLNKNF